MITNETIEMAIKVGIIYSVRLIIKGSIALSEATQRDTELNVLYPVS